MDNVKVLAVSTTAVTDIRLTATQWQLFCDMPDVDTVANDLNRAVTIALAAGPDREAVRREVYRTMSRYARFGASDTEPRSVLAEILDEVYGKEAYAY